LALFHEVAPADVGDLRRCRQVHAGSGALLRRHGNQIDHTAQQFAAPAIVDAEVRCHDAWTQHIDRDTATFQTARQFVGPANHCQLGLGVGLEAMVPRRIGQVFKTQLPRTAMQVRGNIDDAGRSAGLQEIQQPLRQQKWTEVVESKCQLDALGIGTPASNDRTDIVDQAVQTLVAAGTFGGEIANCLQRGQISQQAVDAGIATDLGDLLRGSGRFVGIPPNDHHLRTAPGKIQRGHPTDAASRTGDHPDLASQLLRGRGHALLRSVSEDIKPK